MSGCTSSLVLLLHTTDERDLPSLRDLGNIRPALFERLCKILKEEFDVVDLKALMAGLSGDSATSGRPLAVTFDDGGKSYASFAAPVMNSFGIPSACFLITDCVGGRSLYWRYLFNYCINSGHGRELADTIGAEYGVSLRPEEIISFTRKSYSKEKTGNIMQDISRRIISEEEYLAKEGELFLSAGDIMILKADPLVEFGVHTRSHPVMSGLSEEEIQEEISGSVAFYREKIRDDAPMFSVPFGRLCRDYDERTVFAALKCGVSAVLSAYGGTNERGRPYHNIRRIPVTETMLEGGVDAFVRSLRDASVAPEYIEREASLRDALERWQKL